MYDACSELLRDQSLAEQARDSHFSAFINVVSMQLLTCMTVTSQCSNIIMIIIIILF